MISSLLQIVPQLLSHAMEAEGDGVGGEAVMLGHAGDGVAMPVAAHEEPTVQGVQAIQEAVQQVGEGAPLVFVSFCACFE